MNVNGESTEHISTAARLAQIAFEISPCRAVFRFADGLRSFGRVFLSVSLRLLDGYPLVNVRTRKRPNQSQ